MLFPHITFLSPPYYPATTKLFQIESHSYCNFLINLKEKKSQFDKICFLLKTKQTEVTNAKFQFSYP